MRGHGSRKGRPRGESFFCRENRFTKRRRGSPRLATQRRRVTVATRGRGPACGNGSGRRSAGAGCGPEAAPGSGTAGSASFARLAPPLQSDPLIPPPVPVYSIGPQFTTNGRFSVSPLSVAAAAAHSQRVVSRVLEAGRGRDQPPAEPPSQAMPGTRVPSGTSLDDHARHGPRTVVSCQHGSVATPEEGGRTCVARGRKRRLDRGFDTIRSPMGRHAMRGGRRCLRMPGLHLVYAAKSRQPCQAIEALHRAVSSSERLKKRSAATCPPFTSP